MRDKARHHQLVRQDARLDHPPVMAHDTGLTFFSYRIFVEGPPEIAERLASFLAMDHPYVVPKGADEKST